MLRAHENRPKIVLRNTLERKMSRLDYYRKQCCAQPCKRTRADESVSYGNRRKQLRKVYYTQEPQIVQSKKGKAIKEIAPKSLSKLPIETTTCINSGNLSSMLRSGNMKKSIAPVDHDMSQSTLSTLSCALDCLEHKLKDKFTDDLLCMCNPDVLDLSQPRQREDPEFKSGSKNLDQFKVGIPISDFTHPISYYSEVIDLSKPSQMQHESSKIIEPDPEHEMDLKMDPKEGRLSEEESKVMRSSPWAGADAGAGAWVGAETEAGAEIGAETEVGTEIGAEVEAFICGVSSLSEVDSTQKSPCSMTRKEPVDTEKGIAEYKNVSPEKPLNCSLKKCLLGELRKGDARVEVKAFVLKESEQAHYLHSEVAWGSDGEAMFHDVCWKDMLASLKTDVPFKLCPKEKELVADARKTAEYFDAAATVEREARRMAGLLRASEYAIAFTGAGISTAAGIGDYRGKSGKWTEQDRGAKHGPRRRPPRALHLGSLRPSYTHEAMAKLVQAGVVKHVLSQNVDGLHRLSGIPRERISELHGNSFHERCQRCRARYERPYPVRRRRRRGMGDAAESNCRRCGMDHLTGRVCERQGCNGLLRNTIINFGDALERRVLGTAEAHARRSDLVLCLGSSLSVTPACELLDMGKKPTTLVICNRQPTPFETTCRRDYRGARVYGDVDEVMRHVMQTLLPPDECRAWEAGLAAKGRGYDAQRVEQDWEEGEVDDLIEGV